LKNFSDHGQNVEGSNHIWIAVAGPDTAAAGEATNGPEFHQRDIAPTILSLFGIDPGLFAGVKGKTIAMALRP
jgi:arylsulfatase A-like enzyme